MRAEGLKAIAPKRFNPRTTDSKGFHQLLQNNGLRQSMSGKGNCYDKAQAESFFTRFKAELIEKGIFEDIEQARREIFS